MLFNMLTIISVVLYCMSAFDNGPFVSAKGSVSPSHSSHKNVTEKESSSPLDLFFAKESQRRSDIEKIWQWDTWCQLQPKIGNCSEVLATYYYDAQLDQCRTFGYSGCNGNHNNFRTLVECERHCKGTTYVALKETSRTSFCGLQPSAGLCLALSERFYYDVNAGHCKKFVYGGCGGNQNRFTSESPNQSPGSGVDSSTAEILKIAVLA